MDFMLWVRNVSAVITMIIGVLGLVTTCSKSVRNFWLKIFHISTKELREENRKQSEAIKEIKENVGTVLDKIDDLDNRIEKIEGVSRQDCRNTIKDIYYKYAHTKQIPLYERKTVDRTWGQYQKFPNANSYAKLLYTEICKWEILPPTDHDIIEDD